MIKDSSLGLLFQFLIGRLKTSYTQRTYDVEELFQFLIGRLKTRFMGESTQSYNIVSIPYR